MQPSYEFGPYLLDAARRLLTKDGNHIALAPKTFDLLLLFLQSKGQVLTRTALMTALWPDCFVEEANLSFQVSGLRKALGNGASEWIETVPKYGYRFTATVNAVNRAEVAEEHPRAPEEHRGAVLEEAATQPRPVVQRAPPRILESRKHD